MADAKATFAIGLETEGLVRPGDEAADVLEKLKGKIQGDLKALAQLNAAMKNLKASATPNVAAFKELKEKIDRHRASLGSAQADYVNLGGKLGDLVKKTNAGKGGFRGLTDELAKAGGPLGNSVGTIRRIGTSLGTLRLAAIGTAAAIVALSVAVGVAAVKLVSFGIASANASRAERLHLEGLVSIRNMYGLAAGKASDLQAAIDDVSGSSALGRDKIASYAEQLYKMGLRGQNLADALEGTAIKASVQGEEMASMFMNMAAGANMAGGSVKRLSDDVRSRLGGIAKAKALDLNVQIEKLHENFAQLFAGLNLEKFLGALNKITSLFSQSTVTGQVLKRLMASIFDPLFASTEKGGPLVKRFIQGMILGMLDLEIAVLRVQLWFKETFGDKSIFAGIDWLNVALVSGKVALWTMVAGFVLLGAAVAGVVAIVKPFVMLFAYLWRLVASVDWEGIGQSIVDGLDKVLAKGKALLEMRVSDIAKAIKDKFVSLFEIGSPSKVSYRWGGAITEGLGGGLDKGQPDVSRALQSMVTAPDMPKVGATGQGASGARGAAAGASVTIHELHYHSSGREQHAADAEDFKSQLERVLEGAQIQLGAA